VTPDGFRPLVLPDVELNPPGQYADSRNLAARQRLWRCQVPLFGLAPSAGKAAGPGGQCRTEFMLSCAPGRPGWI